MFRIFDCKRTAVMDLYAESQQKALAFATILTGDDNVCCDEINDDMKLIHGYDSQLVDIIKVLVDLIPDQSPAKAAFVGILDLAKENIEFDKHRKPSRSLDLEDIKESQEIIKNRVHHLLRCRTTLGERILLYRHSTEDREWKDAVEEYDNLDREISQLYKILSVISAT